MIEIKSPTRVDLSGGTLDMWPLYNFVGECKTINIAIDIWTTAKIKPLSTEEVVITSDDYNKTWTFKSLSEFLKSDDSKLALYQKVVQFFISRVDLKKISGFELSTASESPIGGGLGGSSSLIISMLKAFSRHFGYTFKDTDELVFCAHNIESKILTTPTGTQDYYPAANGGLNILTYNEQGIHSEAINIDATAPLKENFLLVYTGRSHHSGLNNFEVLKSCVAKEEKVLNALKTIKDISEEMFDAIQNKSWDLLPGLFKKEIAARIQLTPAFTSPEIERLEKIALSNGALGVKICGAGGGGCVLIWVTPENRQKVIEACEKEKFQCLKSKPVTKLT